MTEAIQLDFPTWTPIAARGREATSPATHKNNWVPGETMKWVGYPDAPMTIEEAWDLKVAGKLLIANNHFPDRVEMVIRTAPASAKPLQRRLDDMAVRHEIALAKADSWLAPLPPLRGVRRR